MTVAHTVAAAGSMVSVALATTDLLVPADTWPERLGTAGILVVAGYFLIRWMMAEMAKKDAQIAAITAAATKANEENTRALIAELREGYETKRRIADALEGLTLAIKGRP